MLVHITKSSARGQIDSISFIPQHPVIRAVGLSCQRLVYFHSPAVRIAFSSCDLFGSANQGLSYGNTPSEWCGGFRQIRLPIYTNADFSRPFLLKAKVSVAYGLKPSTIRKTCSFLYRLKDKLCRGYVFEIRLDCHGYIPVCNRNDRRLIYANRVSSNDRGIAFIFGIEATAEGIFGKGGLGLTLQASCWYCKPFVIQKLK